MVRANTKDVHAPSLPLDTVNAALRDMDSWSEQSHAQELKSEAPHSTNERKAPHERHNIEELPSNITDQRQELGRLIEAGNRCYADGRLEEAADCYRKALALRSDSRTALYSLGVISGQLHQYREAKGLFSRLVDLLEKSDSAVGREVLAAAGGSHREVLAAAHDGLGATSLSLWCELAGSRQPPRKLAEDAEAEFRKATQLNPDLFEAWFGLGVSLHILERLDDAEAAFRRALEIEPESGTATERLRAVLEDKVEVRLFELGYLGKLRKPIYDFTPYENRSLIEVKGKPLSEIVVEERG